MINEETRPANFLIKLWRIRGPAVPAKLHRLPLWAWIIFLCVILPTAVLIRTWDLGELPAGFFCDEAGNGFNAYSILKTGSDENGNKFPLFVWQYAAYKYPGFIYPSIIPIYFFGLSEFSVRLTSALYGTGTIILVFLLLGRLTGPHGGLLGSLFLTVTPWHIHFSRIAFGLSSFPFWVTLGLLFFIEGLPKGKKPWWWAGSGIAFGLTPYCYAIARAFTPLFLLGLTLFHNRAIWCRKGAFLLGMSCFVVVLIPLILFIKNPQNKLDMNYFKNTSVFSHHETYPEALQQVFLKNYPKFYSLRFLFKEGDSLIKRHSVRKHGELLFAFFPFLLLGIMFCIWFRAPYKSFLLWLGLYPLGAAMMNEIPSASRGFIGSPAFAVVSSLGAIWINKGLNRLPWRKSAIILTLIFWIALVGTIVKQTSHYLQLYWNKYPINTAEGLTGFQYGYRKVIKFFKEHRDEYTQLCMTARMVNQPQIFALFYGLVTPEQFLKKRYVGCDIAIPINTSRWYKPGVKTLYSLREEDLALLEDYTILDKVITPGGNVTFVLAEVVQAPKQFISRWMSLGPLEYHHQNEGKDDILSPLRNGIFPIQGKHGQVNWEPLAGPIHWRRKGGWIDLGGIYGKNTEYATAFLLIEIESPVTQSAIVEIIGSEDKMYVWMNGKLLQGKGIMNHPKRIEHLQVQLRQGKNYLMIKSMETEGHWYILTRIVGEDNRDLKGITTRANKSIVKPALKELGITLP
jgi:4-amino-4-deoxy-L-arabinose transferase-like glycosyltransferase